MSMHRVRTILFAAAVVIATACASSLDPTARTPAIDPSPPAADEAITGSAVMPNPGNESPPRDPFTPYSTGPGPSEKTPKPTWSYDDLTDEEKIVADKGPDTRAWQPIHDAYARASAELAQHAAAEAAEHRLGLDGLAGVGVVP